MSDSNSNDFFRNPVLGQPAGLFVIFFTEMWERFSYYGMRALLVLFLTSSIMGDNPGWGWPREHALAIYGSYTALAYLTPILGGYIADKIIGYRWAVIYGCLLMTLGHISMALEEASHAFMYLGLFFLVLGIGLFKPNMTSILSHMYKDKIEKKDGAFSIFYMGVNSGAFLGMLLCGYIGESENWGWSYGFGLAGIFMFIGMLQFYFTQNIFGDIGLKPVKNEIVNHNEDPSVAKLNPFSAFDLSIIGLVSVLGLAWIINDPVSKISNFNLFDFNVGSLSGSNFVILFSLLLFVFVLIKRITQYTPVLRDRMIAVIILAFITVFFWASFEQAGGSMTIFASDYTNRILVGNSKIIFNIVNTILTVTPMAIITFVLMKLYKQTFKKYALGNVVLAIGFAIIWFLVIYMLKDQYLQVKAEIPATWFGILNSLFIITFSPLVAKLWESKYNPPATIKNGLGMILLGIGFGVLAFGSSTIPAGAKVASVSLIWLVLAYFFHTMGELFISPVGLSYLSKLVPSRMIGIMFGIWYLAIAIGNKIAGTMGGMIDEITSQYSMTTFFLIFTLIPIGIGVLIMLLTPVVKKIMHGIH
ncbi:peptide MFS transporter [Flavobacterium sp. 83]|uniref:peptide MFS transporter n=1 Tax=Flavobacterium sp. 83 TaxID=1131812 RepID=UPI000550BF6C|nr:peptide MFS transporter [Flavobacterium sp. 83]